MVRVVVVDDTESVRDLVRLVCELSEQLRVVGVGADGEEAVALATQLKPDAMVLDHDLPGLDGLTAIPLIHRASPETRIVMFSGVDTIAHDALAAGATAFVGKDRGVDDVVAALLAA